MRKIFFILLFLSINITFSQRSMRIGYIDTEYILQNLSEYNEVSKRLDEKALSWKKEVEGKLRIINQKKEALKSERILLTPELIEEIESEIEFEEKEIREYQQKRFGPKGDLYHQKMQLVQPIQDQIFNAIKEIAESKDYDFIFDKSADIVMLYSNKRHDISDQILRIITRKNKERDRK